VADFGDFGERLEAELIEFGAAYEPVEPSPEGSAASRSTFVLDGRLRELRCEGQRIPLQPKPMALLWYLVRHRDRVVPGDELRRAVWRGVHVGEQALSGTLRDLRRALGPAGRELIQTLRGHGYRFLGEVRESVESGDGRVHASVRPGSAPPVSHDVDRGPLVARERELAQLLAILDSARSGEGAICTVVGEAGIGKSRLCEELAIHARRIEVAVHTGVAHCGTGEPPFWLWTQVVRSLLEPDAHTNLATGADPRLPASTASDARDAREHPASVPTSLQWILPELGPSTLMSVSGERPRPRFEIAHSLVQLMRLRGSMQPLLIVLEDLHWADEDSLSVLELVAHSVSTIPVLLLATWRAHDVGLEVPHALALLGRVRRHQRIELQGLPASAVRELLSHARSQPPSEAWVERIRSITNGNPLFISELAKLDRHGSLRPADPSQSPGPIPSAIREALALQLAQRSEACRQMLRVAAVSGDRFSLEIVRRVLDCSPKVLLDALSEAERSGLIHEVEHQPGMYRFHHSLWRDVLYAQFTRTDARRLHLRTGEALEQTHVHDLDAHASTLAKHFGEASPVGGAEKAARYAILAAERSERLWASTDAANHYEAALDAIGHIPNWPARRRCELLIAYARQLHVRVRRWELRDQVCDPLQEASRIALEIGAHELLAQALTEQATVEVEAFAVWPGGFFVPRTRIEHLEVQVRDVLDRLGPDDVDSRVNLRALLAFMRHLAGSPAERDRLISEAQAEADLHRRDSLWQGIAFVRWWFVQAPDALEERTAIAEAIAAGPIDESPFLMSREGILVFARAECGDFEAADRMVQKAHHATEHLQWKDPHVWMWYTLRALMQGEFAAAERYLVYLDRVDEFMIGIARDTQRLWVSLLRGNPEPLLPMVEAAASTVPIPLFKLILARCYLELDRDEAARAALSEAMHAKLTDIPFDHQWLFTLFLATDGIWMSGLQQDADALYQRLLPYENRMVVGGWGVLCVGCVSDALGRLAALSRNWDRAVVHLEQALARYEQLQAHPMLAQVHDSLARVLTGRARELDGSRARDHVMQAHRKAKEIGMLGLAARTSRLIS